MAKKTSPLLPTTQERLLHFGERLRLARQRRQLTSRQVAERAGMAPMTLRGLERGGAGVTMGAYLAVMQVLGIDRDLDLLGQADPLGRALQDAGLPAGRSASAAVLAPAVRAAVGKAQLESPMVLAAAKKKVPQRARAKPAREVRGASDTSAWADSFSSSRALAGSIVLTVPVPKKRRG